MMECGDCGMWLAMPSGALELGCSLGGLEKGKYFAASIRVRGGIVKYICACISVTCLCITNVSSVCRLAES
jgi:hypothetical protein